jgi:hypothetical protein
MMNRMTKRAKSDEEEEETQTYTSQHHSTLTLLCLEMNSSEPSDCRVSISVIQDFELYCLEHNKNDDFALKKLK